MDPPDRHAVSEPARGAPGSRTLCCSPVWTAARRCSGPSCRRPPRTWRCCSDHRLPLRRIQPLRGRNCPWCRRSAARPDLLPAGLVVLRSPGPDDCRAPAARAPRRRARLLVRPATGSSTASSCSHLAHPLRVPSPTFEVQKICWRGRYVREVAPAAGRGPRRGRSRGDGLPGPRRAHGGRPRGAGGLPSPDPLPARRPRPGDPRQPRRRRSAACFPASRSPSPRPPPRPRHQPHPLLAGHRGIHGQRPLPPGSVNACWPIVAPATDGDLAREPRPFPAVDLPARGGPGLVAGDGAGCVHTDLLAAGRIEDPFYRTNEQQLGWIERQDWEWRTTFPVAAAALERERIDLCFDGLDTFAEVFLNGQPILRADNMFRRWRVPVSGRLRAGDNELLVRCRSPITRDLARSPGPRVRAGGDQRSGRAAPQRLRRARRLTSMAGTGATAGHQRHLAPCPSRAMGWGAHRRPAGDPARAERGARGARAGADHRGDPSDRRQGGGRGR